MNIYLFVNDPDIRKSFHKLAKSRACTVIFKPKEAFREFSKHPEPGSLYYIDVSGAGKPELSRLLKGIGKIQPAQLGVIDSSMTVTDITELFRMGAVDYIGRPLLEQGVTWSRIKKVLPVELLEEAPVLGGTGTGTACGETGEKGEDRCIDPELLTGTSWEGIHSGKEYVFSFMFIELDLPPVWKKKSGRDHLNRVMALFHDHVERTVLPCGGRIWMWTEYGGIVLFPFDGKSCLPVIYSIRLMLNRSINSAEEYDFNHRMSWRIVHHIGTTIYRKRGDTGKIVSETVNHIFHLGYRFAQPGNLYLTQPVFDLLPRSIQECFTGQGTFEESTLYRFLRPVPGADGKGAIG